MEEKELNNLQLLQVIKLNADLLINGVGNQSAANRSLIIRRIKEDAAMLRE